jgi:hypothetical protein
MHSEETSLNSRELFYLFSKQKKTVDAASLQETAKLVGWEGDVKQLLQDLVGTDQMSLGQFVRIVNAQSAMN